MDTLHRISLNSFMTGEQFTMTFVSDKPISISPDPKKKMIRLRISPGIFTDPKPWNAPYVYGSIEASDRDLHDTSRNKTWENHLVDLGEYTQQWGNNENIKPTFMIGIPKQSPYIPPGLFEVRKCGEHCLWHQPASSTLVKLEVIPRSRTLNDETSKNLREGADAKGMKNILIIATVALGVLLFLVLFLALCTVFILIKRQKRE